MARAVASLLLLFLLVSPPAGAQQQPCGLQPVTDCRLCGSDCSGWSLFGWCLWGKTCRSCPQYTAVCRCAHGQCDTATCACACEAGWFGTECTNTNCVIGGWTLQGGCSVSCGGGVQLSVAWVQQPAVGSGAPCPALTAYEPCNPQACPPMSSPPPASPPPSPSSAPRSSPAPLGLVIGPVAPSPSASSPATASAAPPAASGPPLVLVTEGFEDGSTNQPVAPDPAPWPKGTGSTPSGDPSPQGGRHPGDRDDDGTPRGPSSPSDENAPRCGSTALTIAGCATAAVCLLVCLAIGMGCWRARRPLRRRRQQTGGGGPRSSVVVAVVTPPEEKGGDPKDPPEPVPPAKAVYGVALESQNPSATAKAPDQRDPLPPAQPPWGVVCPPPPGYV